MRKQDLKPWPYDPERARQLLAERGFKDTDGDGILERGGKKFEIELMAPTENLLRRNIVLLVQESLKKVGVSIKPRIIEFNSMTEPLDETRFRRRGLRAWRSPPTSASSTPTTPRARTPSTGASTRIPRWTG